MRPGLAHFFLKKRKELTKGQDRFVETFDTSVRHSVTRFGDLFDFGQLFKAFGNN